MAAQLLHHFNPSEQISPSFLHHFTPLPANYCIILSPLKKLPPHSYTFLPPLTAQLLHLFTPFWTNYRLTLTPFYPPWQPNSYIILKPLNKLPPRSYTILPTLASQLLNHFTPLDKLPPHSYTILPPPPRNSSILTSFYPLWKNYPSLLQHFIPLEAQLLHLFTPFWTNYTNLPSYITSPLNKLPPHSYTNLLPLAASPTLLSFYPLWTNYPLTLTPINPPWQPNSYIISPPEQITPSLLHQFTPLGSQPNSFIILPPLDKLPPHSYTNLPSLVDQLLPKFITSGKITLSLLHYFPSPLGSPTLTPFYPLWTNYPLTLTPFYPLGSPTLTSFYPLWRNYPLILTPFYHPWLPNYYIILPPSEQIIVSLLHHFTPLGSPTLTAF